MKFEIANNLLKIDGHEIKFPLPVHSLEKLLGQASRHSHKKHNHIYTWDDLGMCAYSKNGQEVQSITLDVSPFGYDFSPSTVFASEFTIECTDFRKYLLQHNNRLEKLSKRDESGSFFFGNISAFFSIDNTNLELIS